MSDRDFVEQLARQKFSYRDLKIYLMKLEAGGVLNTKRFVIYARAIKWMTFSKGNIIQKLWNYGKRVHSCSLNQRVGKFLAWMEKSHNFIHYGFRPVGCCMKVDRIKVRPSAKCENYFSQNYYLIWFANSSDLIWTNAGLDQARYIRSFFNIGFTDKSFEIAFLMSKSHRQISKI